MASQLIHGDCLDKVKAIPDNSIGMVLTDLPYGTTAAKKWDTPIDLDEFWKEIRRVTMRGRAVALTSVQPFSATLVASNLKGFRHEWIWNKRTARGHLVAKKRPMQQHESVLIFSPNGEGVLYNPQMTKLDKPTKAGVERKRTDIMGGLGESTGYTTGEMRTHTYPKTILEFGMDKRVGHSAQKPVALLEYMIRTYSNPGDTVLDMTAGSGSTAIAAINTGREYICIEKDDDYFSLMKNRIENHEKP